MQLIQQAGINVKDCQVFVHEGFPNLQLEKILAEYKIRHHVSDASYRLRWSSAYENPALDIQLIKSSTEVHIFNGALCFYYFYS